MMRTQQPRAYVIPCSGIGKPSASVAREATYRVIEDLRPGVADTLCLSLLTMGDPEATEAVTSTPCIAVDGCPRRCSRANLEQAGGRLHLALQVGDLMREYPCLKPQSVLALGERGHQLADLLAERLAAAVDGLLKPEGVGHE